MRRNKTFGSSTGNHTPFHTVHLAKSGEIVNELNAPICSIDIDDVPKLIREGNGDMLLRVLNGYDALLQVAKAAQAIYGEMGTRLSPAVFDEFSEVAKTALHDSLSNLKRFENLLPMESQNTGTDYFTAPMYEG